MCLREAFAAATWVGFSALALFAVVTPLILG
jgi:hypothetical protein